MPPLEPTSEHDVPYLHIAPPMPTFEPTSDHPDSSYFKKSCKEIHIIQSSPPPIKTNTLAGKGKEIMITVTPVNSPSSSPSNSIGSDLDFLLSKKSLELRALTIHKLDIQKSPHASPNSASTIMVRRKNNKGSRHFRVRGEGTCKGIHNLSLIDVPIIDMTEERPLRESMDEKLPK